MDIILVVRIMITLTFFILAVCGPVAIFQIRKFIKTYLVSHGALMARVMVIERVLHIPDGEHPREPPQ